jgi:hypothetical protein
MVPTRTVRFNKPGLADKHQLLPFTNFRQFMAAIGETVICDEKVLAKIIPRYFNDVSVLEGKRLNITIAYKGTHVKKDGEAYKIVDRDGKQIGDESFPDFTSAKLGASAANITIQDWPEITEYHAKEAEPEAASDEAFDPFA